jgi:hypothetical protein
VPVGRVAAVAAAVATVLWLSLDSGIGGTTPAPPLASGALVILALMFGAGAWAMTVTRRDVERAPLLAGLAIGVGVYALVRLALP